MVRQWKPKYPAKPTIHRRLSRAKGLLPSERRVDGNSHRMREAMRQHTRELQREESPPLLEKLHSPPEWWKGGKQITFQTLKYETPEWTIIQNNIKSKDPDMHVWANKRLLEHFNYLAGSEIRRYFRQNPDSPYTFEQIYGEMVHRQWKYFDKTAQTRGIKVACANLSVSLSSGSPSLFALRGRSSKSRKILQKSKKHQKYFAQAYLRKSYLPGRFPRLVNVELLNQNELDALSPTPRKFSMETRKKVQKILIGNLLTPREKEFVRLLYFNGLSASEAAKRQNPSLSRERVLQINRRILKKIQRAFELKNE